MMTVDPIPALQSLGYTPREATFLSIVAVYSGYFVRRQFDYFIDRSKGAIAKNFLAKAQVAGHIEVIEYPRGWRVYHLFSRPIYRLLDIPESQNRHRKGDGAIRSRLITLDYVLENQNSEHFLSSAEEKLKFFGEHRHLNPGLYRDSSGDLYPVIKSSVISLADRERPASSLVRFLFVEEGLLTLVKFQRILAELEPVLCALRNFELIYASNSKGNFEQAGHEFWKRFARHTERSHGSSLSSARQRPRLDGTITTILYRWAYPPLRRHEHRGSKQSSTSPEPTPSL